MTTPTPSSQMQQIDGGTVAATDPSTGNNLLWFSRKSGTNIEFWAYYKWGQAGGYNPPSASNPSSSWDLKFDNVAFTDYCSFVNWIVQNYSVNVSDITGEQHVITPAVCTENDLQQQNLTTA